jgi:hypothetical protein
VKLRDGFSEVLFEELIPEAGNPERDRLVDKLEDLVGDNVLTRAVAVELETLAGVLGSVMAEAAFVAGLECGRDLRRLVCK